MRLSRQLSPVSSDTSRRPVTYTRFRHPTEVDKNSCAYYASSLCGFEASSGRMNASIEWARLRLSSDSVQYTHSVRAFDNFRGLQQLFTRSQTQWLWRADPVPQARRKKGGEWLLLPVICIGTERALMAHWPCRRFRNQITCSRWNGWNYHVFESTRFGNGGVNKISITRTRQQNLKHPDIVIKHITVHSEKSSLEYRKTSIFNDAFIKILRQYK